jgi:hypothetical protein
MGKIAQNIEVMLAFFMGGIFFILLNISTHGYFNSVAMSAATEFHASYYELEDINILNTSSENAYIVSVQDSFVYNETTTNCQYWSTQWEIYAEQFNYTYRYVTVPHHVFGILYTEETYCIADQYSIICNK